jgi:hypothetical protein
MEPLKLLSKKAVQRAFEKAKHYRLLNDPENAESICLDILEVEENHQEAMVVLILSIVDQFDGGSTKAKLAESYIPRLTDEFHRCYYTGIIRERYARSMLKRGRPGASQIAYDYFKVAMDHFEKAETLTDDQNDDAILRWNSCARTINSKKLEPLEDDNFVAYGDG